MEFTPKERNAINALRWMQGKGRKLMNWTKLLCGFFCIGGAILIFNVMIELPPLAILLSMDGHSAERVKSVIPWDLSVENFVIAAYSVAAVIFCMGIFILVISIIQWRPSRNEKLLFKLLNQLEPLGKTGETT